MVSNDMAEIDTDQLVIRAQSGDDLAKSELLHRHSDRLKRMIGVFLDPRVSSRVDPSDVLQETLTNAAGRLPDYLHDRPGGFYRWLRQIAKDRIIDIHRRHIYADRRSVKRENPDQPWLSDATASRLADRMVSKENSPSSQAGNNERRDKILAALNRLSDSYREVLVMRYMEQLTTREIAEILSTTDSAIKSRLWRALEKMNQMVGTGLEEIQ